MKLKDLQQKFKDCIIKGEIDPNLPILEDGLEIENRLYVYQNNTFGTLRDFLQSAYPKVAALLGDESFKEISTYYIQTYPPQKPHLDLFAPPFADFLEEIEEDPFIIEVARFENALRASLFTDMPESLSPEKLQAHAAKDPDQLCFTFHPSVSFFPSKYAFQTFWHSLETDPPSSFPDQKPTLMLVHLEGLLSVFKPLSEAEAAFLKSLKHGQPIACALEKALEKEESFDLPAKLSYYMSHNIFRDCTIKTEA